MRRRHISSGAPQTVLPETASAPQAQGDVEEPSFRSRATSWGARDRLRMQRIEKDLKISGAAGGAHGETAMSQLLGGNSPAGRKMTPVEKNTGSEHIFTGKALIWQKSHDDTSKRRLTGTKSLPPTPVGYIGSPWNTSDVTELDQMEIEDLEVNDPMIFNKFMRAHKCYDLIPTSAKLVVFDTQLSVKKAFYALVYNCVRAAPLWESSQQKFIGMLTITDFIKILHKYYKSPVEIVDQLEEHKIQSWRLELSSFYKPFVSISPDASVHEAIRSLLSNKVHRLPVIDPITGNALYIITHKRVLKFLYIFMKHLPKPAYINQSIGDLNLGTYKDIATVTLDMKLIDALSLFVNRRVSALPVIDQTSKVENIYAKFDVINLAAEKTYKNLDIPISLALSQRKSHENVISCRRTDSLHSVIEKIVKAEVHRLVVLHEDGTLDGVISLSDILQFLLREDTNGIRHSVAATCSASTLTDDDKMEMFSEPLEAV